MAEIKHGDYALKAAPELGGAITQLSWRGADLLRPTPLNASDVLQTSCFPLAPYANRIAHGAFTFQGKPVQLALNFGDHPHALHGHAWQRAWRLEEESGSRLRLIFDYKPGDWPWPYRCEQTLELDGSGALLTLSLQNRADAPMPASIGFHPYFPRPQGARLIASVGGMWQADEFMLPTRYVAQCPPQLAEGAPLDDAPFIDNCFTPWSRAAVLTQNAQHTISITASPELDFLHVYLPIGEKYVCIEPVSAMPDAINRAAAPAGGLRVLAPGETFSGAVRIEATLPTS